jgi:hypothetical protein
MIVTTGRGDAIHLGTCGGVVLGPLTRLHVANQLVSHYHIGLENQRCSDVKCVCGAAPEFADAMAWRKEIS